MIKTDGYSQLVPQDSITLITKLAKDIAIKKK